MGEMYRQGLYVEKDIKKACKYYQKIAYYYSYSHRFDPYYWRACYRLAMLIYEARKTEKRLNEALHLLIEAKDLYGKPPSLDNVVKLILILILLTAVDFSAVNML